MKSNPLTKIASLLTAALFLASLTATATAGPGSVMAFHAVPSEKAASKLKVGSQIAVSCDQCHGISVMAVDAERSYLRTYTCPMCKLKFTTLMPGGGGRGTVGSYSYSDGAGHTAHLTAIR